MNVEVDVLATSEKGVCVMRSTASSTSEAFWLAKDHCEWAVSPIGGLVAVEVPDWMARKHRQLVGDEKFEGAKQQRKQTMSTNTEYAPSFRLTRLYRKTAHSGATYFSGRLAGGKIVLVKSKDVTDDGAEIWNLLISEAPAKPQNTQAAPGENGKRDFGKPNGASPGAF